MPGRKPGTPHSDHPGVKWFEKRPSVEAPCRTGASEGGKHLAHYAQHAVAAGWAYTVH